MNPAEQPNSEDRRDENDGGGRGSSLAFQNIRSFIEKSKQPSKYIQEHRDNLRKEDRKDPQTPDHRNDAKYTKLDDHGRDKTLEAVRLNTPMHRNRMAMRELADEVKKDPETSGA